VFPVVVGYNNASGWASSISGGAHNNAVYISLSVSGGYANTLGVDYTFEFLSCT